MIQSTNKVFYAEGETYHIDRKTGEIEKEPCVVHQGIGQYSLEDAIKDMHETVTKRAQFYRNRNAFVEQQSKRKTLITTLRVNSDSDNFFAKYYITYRKDDNAKPITVDNCTQAEQLLDKE